MISFGKLQKEHYANLHREYIKQFNKDAGTFSYIDQFLRLTCAPDLIEKKIFPNSKEICESMAAYHAVVEYLDNLDLGSKNVTVLCVGDGSTPRTAALFAHRSNWKTISVDPKLTWNNSHGISRLKCIPSLIEHISCIEDEKVIIIAVHSHALLQAAFDKVRANTIAVVAIPCCVEQTLDKEPDIAYDDNKIPSPARAVYIWKNLLEENNTQDYMNNIVSNINNLCLKSNLSTILNLRKNIKSLRDLNDK